MVRGILVALIVIVVGMAICAVIGVEPEKAGGGLFVLAALFGLVVWMNESQKAKKRKEAEARKTRRAGRSAVSE